MDPAVDCGYDTYLGVRAAVLQMKREATSDADASRPSDYWSRELENLDYMIEATALIVRKLRHHAFHITSIRPYDYRDLGDRRICFERRFRALVELGGRDLVVPEHPALGGFGFEIDGALYNVDTLKFLEVLVGMKRGEVLAPFGQSGRRLVWEVGAGWGGFAYQFKTLFPNTTYVIVDFPELFLFSATYLATLFPGAAVRFADGRDDVFSDWEHADFIFVPHTSLELLRSVRPDLLVNLVSFQEMTEAQAERYLALAAEIGCPVLYSLNRDRSPYSTQIANVSAIIERRYELHPVSVLGSDYTKAMKKDSAVTAAEGDARLERARQTGEEVLVYRHLVGRLRAPAYTGVASPIVPGRIAIGATLHNRAQYLREALDSLLAQSCGDFRLLLIDDGSTDETQEIAREYASRDARIVYVRHEERLGMVATWRRAFELAAADPATQYFAWASDHDRWHQDWLATLVGVLDAHADVVLAYPLTQRIDPEGEPLSKPARLFDTFGVTDLRARWVDMSTTRSLAAGDMVYGLMRVDAMRKAGVFREVLSPDRLLMAELTIQGQIHQVPEVLWYRRQFETGSVARQKHSLFGSRARASVLPTWLQHARVLWHVYASGDGGPLASTRGAARWLVARYAMSYAMRHHRKTTVHRTFAGFLEWCRHLYKRAKHFVLAGIFYTLVYSRRAFWGTVYYLLVGLRRVHVTPAVEWVYERITGRPRQRASDYRYRAR